MRGDGSRCSPRFGLTGRRSIEGMLFALSGRPGGRPGDRRARRRRARSRRRSRRPPMTPATGRRTGWSTRGSPRPVVVRVRPVDGLRERHGGRRAAALCRRAGGGRTAARNRRGHDLPRPARYRERPRAVRRRRPRRRDAADVGSCRVAARRPVTVHDPRARRQAPCPHYRHSLAVRGRLRRRGRDPLVLHERIV